MDHIHAITTSPYGADLSDGPGRRLRGRRVVPTVPTRPHGRRRQRAERAEAGEAEAERAPERPEAPRHELDFLPCAPGSTRPPPPIRPGDPQWVRRVQREARQLVLASANTSLETLLLSPETRQQYEDAYACAMLLFPLPELPQSGLPPPDDRSTGTLEWGRARERQRKLQDRQRAALESHGMTLQCETATLILASALDSIESPLYSAVYSLCLALHGVALQETLNHFRIHYLPDLMAPFQLLQLRQ